MISPKPPWEPLPRGRRRDVREPLADRKSLDNLFNIACSLDISSVHPPRYAFAHRGGTPIFTNPHVAFLGGLEPKSTICYAYGWPFGHHQASMTRHARAILEPSDTARSIAVQPPNVRSNIAPFSNVPSATSRPHRLDDHCRSSRCFSCHL